MFDLGDMTEVEEEAEKHPAEKVLEEWTNPDPKSISEVV